MVDFTDVEQMRPALAILCRDAGARINGRNDDVANRWWPYTVRDPDTQMFFTDLGAWDFIADCLQRGCSINCMAPTSDHPDFCYYMIEGGRGEKRIYMKIAIRPQRRAIVGISFHYEDPR